MSEDTPTRETQTPNDTLTFKPSGEVVPVKERAQKRLPCKLTDAEMLDKSRLLARTLTEIEEAKAEQERTKREMKDALATLEEDAKSIYRTVLSGEEERLVDVEDRNDYEQGRIFRVRLDTGEVYFERAMTEEERQVSFA